MVRSYSPLFVQMRWVRLTRGSPAPLAALAPQKPGASVTAPAVVPGLSIPARGWAGAVPGAGFGIREIVIRPLAGCL